MNRIRVIAPMGLAVPGPATFKLSADQLDRRGGLFSKPKAGKVTLAEGKSVTFKCGEVLEIEDLGKLPRSAFMKDDAKAKPKAKAPTKPKGGNGSDTVTGGSGSDTVTGGSGSDTVTGGSGSDDAGGDA